MGGENREVAGLFKILLVPRSEKKQVKSRHFNFFSYTTYCRAFRVRTLGACRRGTGVIAEPRLGEAKLKRPTSELDDCCEHYDLKVLKMHLFWIFGHFI